MPVETSATYYDILGVAPTATAEEIKRAYRRVVLTAHPDQGGSAALFRQVQVAFECLGDAERRALYDRTEFGGEGSGFSPPPPPREEQAAGESPGSTTSSGSSGRRGAERVETSRDAAGQAASSSRPRDRGVHEAAPPDPEAAPAWMKTFRQSPSAVVAGAAGSTFVSLLLLSAFAGDVTLPQVALRVLRNLFGLSACVGAVAAMALTSHREGWRSKTGKLAARLSLRRRSTDHPGRTARLLAETAVMLLAVTVGIGRAGKRVLDAQESWLEQANARIGR